MQKCFFSFCTTSCWHQQRCWLLCNDTSTPVTDEQVRGQHKDPDHDVWFTFQWKLCILSGSRINLWLNPPAESYTPNPSTHPPICFCIHLSIRPARSPAFTLTSLLFLSRLCFPEILRFGLGGCVLQALRRCAVFLQKTLHVNEMLRRLSVLHSLAVPGGPAYLENSFSYYFGLDQTGGPSSRQHCANKAWIWTLLLQKTGT